MAAIPPYDFPCTSLAANYLHTALRPSLHRSTTASVPPYDRPGATLRPPPHRPTTTSAPPYDHSRTALRPPPVRPYDRPRCIGRLCERLVSFSPARVRAEASIVREKEARDSRNQHFVVAI